MKKFIAIATAVLVPVVASAGTTQEEILSKIEAMQKQIAEQQAVIESMKAQLGQSTENVSELVKQEVQQELEKGFAQVKDTPTISFGSAVKGLKLTGDARFRYERLERKVGANAEQNADYNRTRFRLGFVWQTTEDWEVGAGLATGGGGATSTNATWSNANVFETGDIRLDYAYAAHKWENLKVTVGQQKNPFETSDIFWDSDVRPAGLTVQADMEPFFATVGAYQVRYFGGLGNTTNAENASLLAGQVGATVDVADGVKWMLALGYQHFDSNTSRNMAPAMDRDYRFQIGDVYTTLDGKVGDAKVGLFGHVWKNFGADGAANSGQLQFAGNTETPEDNDMGWVVGVKGAMGAVSVNYLYGRIEPDSIYTEIKDADFGGSGGMSNTDVKGHKLGASYAVSKNFSLGGSALFMEQTSGPDREGTLYQLDAVYKF